MRIAIINWSTRRVGGVETYLNTIIPELFRAGHEIAFWSEVDEPSDRVLIQLPDKSPTWCVASMGVANALAALRDWGPEITFAHKLADPELENKVIKLAPSVFFAHDYNGTCISGTKTFQFPVVRPCSRQFGWKCLVNYFPRRCGGLSPVTMLKLYALQAKRLENLHSYDAVLTHSDHMLAELMKHGLSPRRAFKFPYYVQSGDATRKPANLLAATASASSPTEEAVAQTGGVYRREKREEWRLLFSGRMEHLKGAHVFLEALPQVVSRLGKRLRVTFAGDGRERQTLERKAARLRSPRLEIEFTGWLEHTQVELLLKECDLLVVPSLWPEPFGLVGAEAGQFGVPVAAFNVGGIPDWLSDGVNGFLASGSPPTSEGLAQAIIKCLDDPVSYARLRQGATEVAQRFNIKNHLTALQEVFENVIAHH
jgi:glycosyltransferase involved in cell wall biosynthesis